MCKLAIIQSVKPGKEKRAWQLAKVLTPHLVANDDDGFGYMALGDEGLFGERWLDVTDAWKYRSSDTAVLNSETYWPYADVLESLVPHNTFGTHTPRTYAIALHSRKATCGVSLQNVHPFVAKDNKSAVVHNGIINNSAAFPSAVSTCDSEAILTNIAAVDMADGLYHVQALANKLTGWYAYASFIQCKDGTWVLDIVKDKVTDLYAMLVPNLDAWVFVTDLDHLLDALETLKWKKGGAFKVTGGRAVRADAKTGDILDTASFNPRSMTNESYWNGMAASEGSGRMDDFDDYYAGRHNRVKYLPSGTASPASDDMPEEDSETTDVYDHINMSILKANGSKQH